MVHVQPARDSGRCSLSLSHRLWFGDVFTLATRLRYPKKHMNRFEQIRKTLLSVSKEKRNYERALAEWEYRGDFYDNEAGSAICQLCGQRDIRYEFEITNEKSGKTLLVGSEC